MPKRARFIPPITPVERDLAVDSVADIIATAERAQTRRRELVAALNAALEAGDTSRALELARALGGMETKSEP